jgi:hypothetical protein
MLYTREKDWYSNRGSQGAWLLGATLCWRERRANTLLSVANSSLSHPAIAAV